MMVKITNIRHIQKILSKVDFFKIERIKNDETEIFIRNNFVDEGTTSVSESYDIRLWKGKQTISAEFNSLGKKEVEQVYSMLKTAPKKPYFYGLPKAEKPRKVQTYCSKTAKLPIEKMIEEAKLLRDTAKDKNVDVTFGVVNKSVSETEVITSTGFQDAFKGTHYSVNISATAKMGENRATSWEGMDSRIFTKTSHLAAKVKTLAKQQLIQKKMKKIPRTIVLDSKVVAQLLQYAILPNFKLNAVEDKRSMYDSFLNKKIWNDEISLEDNPVKAMGTSSYPFDSEGSIAKKTTLIKKGVLKRFISDYNTAKHLDMPGTPNSNGTRIGFSNIIMKGETSDLKEHVYIGDVIGAHTAEPFSGRFSVMADGAILVMNGKKTPIAPFLISGSMHEILKGDVKFTGKVRNNGSVYSRNLVTTDLSVVL